MTLFPEDILKLLLALALGGIIGAERELRDKDAGFRTLMFICALERMMGTVSQVRTYSITTSADRVRFADITERFRQYNLLVMKGQVKREGSDMVCTWTVSGRPKDHEAMSTELFDDPLITKFES